MLRLKEIDIIRALVIVALVANHSFAPYTGAWPTLPVGSDSAGYHWFGKLLYSGMLETFVCISGYVFALGMQNKNISLGSIALSKTRRLLIPCLVWGIIYLLTVFPLNAFTQASSYWRIVNGIGHLWFLPMLFWCFILEYLVNKCFTHSRLLYVVLGIAAILPYPAMPFYFNNSLYFLFFFHCGYTLFHNKEKFIRLFCHPIRAAFLLLGYVALFTAGTLFLENANPADAPTLIHKAVILTEMHAVRFLYSSIAVILYFIIGYSLSGRISTKLYNATRFVAVNSFGIYLLQEIVLRILYYRSNLLAAIGGGQKIAPWIGFLVAFCVSLALSWLLSKNKYTKKFC